ncbi:MIP/aquaporin family protein [Acetobacter fallax]|uniref:Porin n=1 Tax=Acetobacter fallax TaxID=1737473 RepID=A0ABX0KBM5_9PROT|nr:aquaporin [Acetobacter fallax]NHO32263.1 porin [Acetobacter fallax]NHO35823.1 porin [Acetobacter fallax]
MWKHASHLPREAGHTHPDFHPIRFTRRELDDRPLAGAPHPNHLLHWKLYGCEAVATAIMMIIGVVSVILLSGDGSPFARLLDGHPYLQTALCGLFFGSAGTWAAMTRFGKVSGAHLSPSVSLAFALAGRLSWIDALGYVCAQTLGALAGTGLVSLSGALFRPWEHIAASAHYAATIPTAALGPLWVVVTEIVVTAGLIFALYWAAAHPRLQLFTPWIGGWYFFIMNPVFAWISGDSTNFARSLGPAIFDGNLTGIWIYLIGPLIGSACAVGIIRSGLVGYVHLAEARIVNFGHHGRVPHLNAPDVRSAEPVTAEDPGTVKTETDKVSLSPGDR